MQKIGASTASANALGEFTEGNPGAGVAATLLKAAWLNAVQRELVHLVEGAGLTLDSADDSQILKAIQAIQTNASTWLKLSGKPTTISGFGITDAFTKAETTTAIQQRIADLVASSPASLDTLKELADALGNDPNFATTMTNALAGKANKATTLSGYGITDAYPKTGTYSRAEVDELLKYATSLPVGAMVPFPSGSVPAGFLEVDGSVQSAATYPDLAAYLGTTFNRGDEGAGNFRLPESRGEFLRGWDHGRGVDAGRGLGTYQGDAIRNITGSVASVYMAGAVAGTGAYSVSQYGSSPAKIGAVGGDPGNNSTIFFDASKVVPTANENRPRNITVMWCIKAWNAPINQGNIDIAALSALADQATEMNQGTAKIATDSQMLDSANDAVIATPKKLRKGFAIGLGLNGHIALPWWLGSLVLQWGSVPVSAASAAIAFPIEFPNALYTVIGSPVGTSSSSGAGGGAISSGSRTGATVYVWGTGNWTYRWFAIGS